MSDEVVPGSARGVRVAGAIWAGAVLAVSAFMIWAYDWWTGLAFAAPVSVFLAVRPWFMGVVLRDSDVLFKSWWRSRLLLRESITNIELAKCDSLLMGFQVGFLPFVGKVRMMNVEVTAHGRTRFLPLSSTLGRYNTTLKVTRILRSHVGLPRF
jgi:hypothetical protein